MSLAVIMVEITNDIQFLLLIMTTIMFAKESYLDSTSRLLAYILLTLKKIQKKVNFSQDLLIIFFRFC